jgi:hypothetical protein
MHDLVMPKAGSGDKGKIQGSPIHSGNKKARPANNRAG